MKTENVADKADEMKSRAREWTRIAAEKTRRASDAAEQYVGENVWKSVAIAAGIGALVGFAIAKSCGKD